MEETKYWVTVETTRTDTVDIEFGPYFKFYGFLKFNLWCNLRVSASIDLFSLAWQGMRTV